MVNGGWWSDRAAVAVLMIELTRRVADGSVRLGGGGRLGGV